MRSARKRVFEVAFAIHAGMTEDEFDRIGARLARIGASTRSSGGCSRECVYQPQLELLDYLRANGFKTFIVSGGGIDLIRAFAEEVYGIPPEQVIGSQREDALRARATAAPCWSSSPSSTASTTARSSRRTSSCISAGGRSSRSATRTATWPCCATRRPATGARLALLLHHDDAEREFAYDRDFG